MRYDDIRLDVPVDIGAWLFTEGDILDFARAFDPQPFHLDAEAAAASPYGGLIASGWQVCGAWMRLTADHARKSGEAFGISPGMEEIRWLKPVRPGDSLAFTNVIRAKRRLNSRPGWAMVELESVAVNQKGETAFTMRGPVMLPIDG